MVARTIRYEPIRRSHLNLTEAFTWTLNGECSTDADVVSLQRYQIDSDVVDWHDAYGPIGQLAALELIASGCEHKADNGASLDVVECTKNHISKARNWLSEKKLSPGEGLRLIRCELARRAVADEREKRLQSLCFELCGAEKITLHARKLDNNGKVVQGLPQPIPCLFFTKPTSYTMGNGYYKPGELARSTEVNHEPLETILDEPNAWPTFFEVEVSREDAERLRSEFETWDSIKTQRAVFKLVEYDELTPEDGEELCAKLGVGPLVQGPDKKLCDPMLQSDWSFAMVCAWIATRNLDVVRRFTDEYLKHSDRWDLMSVPCTDPTNAQTTEVRWIAAEHPFDGAWVLFSMGVFDGEDWEERATMLPLEAKSVLWEALQTETIFATAFSAETGRPEKIPGHLYSHLDIQSRDGIDSLIAKSNSVAGQALYETPLIRRDSILQCWPAENVDAADFTAEPIVYSKNIEKGPTGPALKTLHQIWPALFSKGLPASNAEIYDRILKHLAAENTKQKTVSWRSVDRYMSWRRENGQAD